MCLRPFLVYFEHANNGGTLDALKLIQIQTSVLLVWVVVLNIFNFFIEVKGHVANNDPDSGGSSWPQFQLYMNNSGGFTTLQAMRKMSI